MLFLSEHVDAKQRKSGTVYMRKKNAGVHSSRRLDLLVKLWCRCIRKSAHDRDQRMRTFWEAFQSLCVSKMQNYKKECPYGRHRLSHVSDVCALPSRLDSLLLWMILCVFGARVCHLLSSGVQCIESRKRRLSAPIRRSRDQWPRRGKETYRYCKKLTGNLQV